MESDKAWRTKWLSEVEKEEGAERDDLYTLAQLLQLKIVREERFEGTWTIVVLGSEDQEVHIGFPHGRARLAPGIVGKVCATRRIPGVSMSPYGHGHWLYTIDI